MINLKSGLTLLESLAGTWYLQMLHVLSQIMLLKKFLAQEKTDMKAGCHFIHSHPLWIFRGDFKKHLAKLQ